MPPQRRSPRRLHHLKNLHGLLRVLSADMKPCHASAHRDGLELISLPELRPRQLENSGRKAEASQLTEIIGMH